MPGASCGVRGARLVIAAASMLVAGCSKAPPPEPAPVPEAEAPPPPPGPVLAPSTAAGIYQLRSQIQGQGQPRNPRSSRAQSSLRLDAQPTAAPMMGAPAGSQFNATIALPGYTHAPRGRSAQAAAWWPIPGDSVIVQFDTARDGVLIQLRGALSGSAIQGEIWYVSLSSGATFQLGTFTATRERSRGR